jgi:SAM-dependent methyltransferase
MASSLNSSVTDRIVEHYAALFRAHGDSPEAVQWDTDAQISRFAKLVEIGDLAGAHVLDVGCGLGHLYPFLKARFDSVRYTGIDVVPAPLAWAASRFPDARFLCRDVVAEPLEEDFDYALMSGIFNNATANATDILKAVIAAVFQRCTKGMAFNFISDRVNFRNPEMAYHDAVDVLQFCLSSLSWKVCVHHHYRRCDVVMFVLR